MNNNKKCEGNNQWSGSNECATNKANRNKKDATNNEWTSTLKNVSDSSKIYNDKK